ncbi:MAG: hypothetical protein AAB867_00845, partial [Patescibacteria group bacterium]
RDKLTISADASTAAKVTFTTALAGKEYTLNYAKDTDKAADSTLGRVNLADASNKTIVVQENDTVQQGNIVVVNAGDNGMLLEVTSVGPGSSASDKTTLTDVISGKSYDFATGLANTSNTNIEGNTYYIWAKPGGSNANITITWGGGAASGESGTERTLFPRIKLKNGQWMSILTETFVNNNTLYQLLGPESRTTYEAGARFNIGNSSGASLSNLTTVTSNTVNITYNVSQGEGVNVGNRSVNSGEENGTINKLLVPACNFNRSLGPAILILEEKTTGGRATTNGEITCIPLTSEGTTTVTPAIGTPTFTDPTVSAFSLESKTDKNQWLDVYGALFERDVAS